MFGVSRIRNAALFFQNRAYPVGACQRLGDGNDQIGHLDQLHQNLRHIIDQSHGLALGDDPCIYLFSRYPNHCHDSKIDDHVGDRVHQSRYFPHKNLEPDQLVIGFPESVDLILLPVEGPDNPRSCQVLSGGQGHLIQLPLYLLVQGHAKAHDPEHHHTEGRNGHHKNHSRLYIHCKGHDHGAEHNKGRTQEKPQSQVESGLDLIYITGHPGDQSGCADRILLTVGEAPDMGEQIIAQICAKAHRRLGGKILSSQGTGQADKP